MICRRFMNLKLFYVILCILFLTNCGSSLDSSLFSEQADKEISYTSNHEVIYKTLHKAVCDRKNVASDLLPSLLKFKIDANNKTTYETYTFSRVNSKILLFYFNISESDNIKWKESTRISLSMRSAERTFEGIDNKNTEISKTTSVNQIEDYCNQLKEKYTTNTELNIKVTEGPKPDDKIKVNKNWHDTLYTKYDMKDNSSDYTLKTWASSKIKPVDLNIKTIKKLSDESSEVSFLVEYKE